MILNNRRGWILGLMLLFQSLSAWAGQVTLLSVNFTPEDRRLSLTVRLAQPVPVHVFRLTHPARIVLDFEGTKIRGALKPVGLPVSGIRAVRTGYPRDGVLRLVIDVDNAIHFQKRFQTDKASVRLDLFPFTTHLKKTAETPSAVGSPPPHPVVVIIDPGHGGRIPGARGIAGTREKEVVLHIARMLAAEISQTPGMRAVLTRNGDYFVPLRERLRLARRGKGDIFIAIHADSWFDHDASGASAYALSRHGATSEAARWLAGRENDSELAGVNLRELEDQSVVLKSVLIDLAQTATIRDSLRLGNTILQPLRPVTGLHYRHVEQAPFMVLKSPDIPSILVETGFLSNADEELRLRNSAYQERIAHALFEGIQAYIKKYPPSVV